MVCCRKASQRLYRHLRETTSSATASYTATLNPKEPPRPAHRQIRTLGSHRLEHFAGAWTFSPTDRPPVVFGSSSADWRGDFPSNGSPFKIVWQTDSLHMAKVTYALIRPVHAESAEIGLSVTYGGPVLEYLLCHHLRLCCCAPLRLQPRLPRYPARRPSGTQQVDCQ